MVATKDGPITREPTPLPDGVSIWGAYHRDPPVAQVTIAKQLSDAGSRDLIACISDLITQGYRLELAGSGLETCCHFEQTKRLASLLMAASGKS